MRPSVPRGSPLPVTFVQDLPPFVLWYKPLPGPPPAKPHAVRCRSYIAAHRLFGLVGSIASSVAPVSSVTKSVFVQFLPPSVVMKTPRSWFGP